MRNHGYMIFCACLLFGCKQEINRPQAITHSPQALQLTAPATPRPKDPRDFCGTTREAMTTKASTPTGRYKRQERSPSQKETLWQSRMQKVRAYASGPIAIGNWGKTTTQTRNASLEQQYLQTCRALLEKDSAKKSALCSALKKKMLGY